MIYTCSSDGNRYVLGLDKKINENVLFASCSGNGKNLIYIIGDKLFGPNDWPIEISTENLIDIVSHNNSCYLLIYTNKLMTYEGKFNHSNIFRSHDVDVKSDFELIHCSSNALTFINDGEIIIIEPQNTTSIPIPDYVKYIIGIQRCSDEFRIEYIDHNNRRIVRSNQFIGGSRYIVQHFEDNGLIRNGQHPYITLNKYLVYKIDMEINPDQIESDQNMVLIHGHENTIILSKFGRFYTTSKHPKLDLEPIKSARNC